MKISIIIPVYNSSLTLNECLGAIFNSSFKNFEVIIVSDNSPDNSVMIAKKYQCKIIELPKNQGPAFARNSGAQAAAGDILFFPSYMLHGVTQHRLRKPRTTVSFNIQFI